MENYTYRGDLWSVLTKCYSGEQIKKNEMGGACGMRMDTGEVHTGFWWGDLMERHNLEDLDADGSVILKFISKK